MSGRVPALKKRLAGPAAESFNSNQILIATDSQLHLTAAMQMRRVINMPDAAVAAAPNGDPDSEKGANLVIFSSLLFAGRREVIIQHGTEQYRLRLTNSNKLILVK